MKLLLQLADTLVEKGHAHAPNIKQWVEEVKFKTNHTNMNILSIGPHKLNISFHEKLNLNLTQVDDTYKNFSTRMDKYREKVNPQIYAFHSILQNENFLLFGV